MFDFLLWLVFIIGLGWLAFPLCFAFFRRAFDRGFTAARVVGLLLWGYLYWIGNLSGLLANNRGGALTALFLLLCLSLYFLKRNGVQEMTAWLKENKKLVVFHEVVFALAFLIWAVVRGANPQISGTEKPMELAFINSIFRSPAFPPNDPWLSGYSISYYYFGYLLVAAVMHLLGTASGVAFNLAVALTFGLVAAISSGILVNLLAKKEMDARAWVSKKRLRRILLVSLIAPLIILVVSNAEGFLEMLHAKGIFWQTSSDGQLVSDFWQWLDIRDISQPPSLPLDWKPGRAGGSWWWRASRVLQDYTVAGQSREIIDEFPFFSFLLADLHPHVLCMPYVLLAAYIGFYFFQFPLDIGAGIKQAFAFFKSPRLWFMAFTTGSLIFINTWDFPIYFGLITLACFIPLVRKNGWSKGRISELFTFAVPFGIACITMYLPFLLGLSSQAGGLLPSLNYRTRMVHFLVMFFPQLLILTVFLGSKVLKQQRKEDLLKIFIVGVAGALILFAASLLIPGLSAWIPQLTAAIGRLLGVNMDARVQNMQITNQGLLGIYGASSAGELVQAAISAFVRYPLMVVFLIAVLSICLYLIFTKGKDSGSETQSDVHLSDRYALVLVALAGLLAIFPEFFYLRDQFGWRMNTIFKFYFQAWILFSIAAAYAVGTISFSGKKTTRILLSAGTVLVLAVGLIYPAFAIPDKTNSFRNMEWSLDGNLFYEMSNPGEAEAITFLSRQPYGIVAEAIGGSYSSLARVSRLSGFPTVLGWPGHELQWRGGGREIGSRETDIEELYETHDWKTARRVLDQYDIKYVFISFVERSAYQVRESKFNSYLDQIFRNNDVVIYSYSKSD